MPTTSRATTSSSAGSLEVTAYLAETGGLRVEVLATPGHSTDGVSFVVGGELCSTGEHAWLPTRSGAARLRSCAGR